MRSSTCFSVVAQKRRENADRKYQLSHLDDRIRLRPGRYRARRGRSVTGSCALWLHFTLVRIRRHCVGTRFLYQAILERRPAPIIPRLKEILAKPDPALVVIST